MRLLAVTLPPAPFPSPEPAASCSQGCKQRAKCGLLDPGLDDGHGIPTAYGVRRGS